VVVTSFAPGAVVVSTIVETKVETKTVTVTPEEPAAPAPAAGTTIGGDGTYLVGTDIKPGTYRTSGPAGSGCYWARLKNTSGDSGSILANDNTDGPTVVTIKPTDGAFETSGCADWTRI
jgi:hypothetical protein